MVKLQFYPVEFGYKILDNRCYMQMYGRRKDDSKQIVVQEPFEPYLYVLVEGKEPQEVVNGILAKDIVRQDKSVVIARTAVVESRYNGKDVQLVQIFTKLPQDINAVGKALANDFLILEADFSVEKRYLVDRGIIPMVLTDVDGDYINQKSKVSVVDAKEVTQKETEVLDEPRMLAIDIETYNPTGKNVNAEKHPIVMVAFFGRDLHKVLVSKYFKSDEDYVEVVEGEAALLRRFQEVVEEYKPDILTGYYSDGFDIPYLARRAEKHNLSLKLGLDYSDIKVDRRRVTVSSISGIAHLDVLQFLKRAFSTTLETDKFSLGDVAHELLGEAKADVDIRELAEVYDKNPERLGVFCKYNLRDAELTYRLAQEIMPSLVELIKIVGVPIFEISRMGFSQLVESYLIRRACEQGDAVPNKPSGDEIRSRLANTYEGAFVYKPKAGLYSNIIVFDFRSLYPSIITTHNISPETLNCECCQSAATVPGEEYRFCKKKRGFIAEVIEELITRRNRVREIAKSKTNSKILAARSYALKTVANAMYGYLGFYMARWYCIECAESITAYGRFYIQKLIDESQKQG
ncbi:DNA-directed DNA polymerase, partial [Candidatus Woesearchaeota archaeon]|nr:DNA-directed DNA polymerase [Candidatus Woesearchaeota archaeon]